MSFLRRNLAFFKLAIVTNLEYRLNYLVDAIVQPVLTALIEVAFWSAVFKSQSNSTEVGGFTLSSYLSYAIWASFMARISSNWMYEFRMTEEIEMGSLSTLLLRPMNFFEYYLSQFLGYKFVTTLISLMIPALLIYELGLPTLWTRLGLSLILTFYYLIFLYLVSFIVSTLAFHMTKIHGITVAKNLMLLILSGELLPIDLFPEPYRNWLLHLPFSNGVFVPVAYVCGRIELEQMIGGFVSISVGILVLAALAHFFWMQGLKSYLGTGA